MITQPLSQVIPEIVVRKMSYLTETATLELDASGNVTAPNTNGTPASYEYHLPHTKTIDLIGEEFAPKRAGDPASGHQPAVIVETIGKS